MKGTDGYYDVYVMDVSGNNEKCLTCDKPELPNKHIGQPAWDPSGNYIVFQAQKSKSETGFTIDGFASPGAGVNNDLWIMDSSGNRFWQLTDVRPRAGGTLHPHFSRDGSKLLWTERIGNKDGCAYGEWALKIGDFRINNGTPVLENIKSYQPGDQKCFYESHSFLENDKKIIFSGNLEPGLHEVGIDIYTLDLTTGDVVNLTNSSNEWDEHAQVSPDGKTIVWVSSRGYRVNPKTPYKVQLDLWKMNVDGSDKERVTYFNDPKSKEYWGRIAVADNAWSPDGKTVMAFVSLNEISKGEGHIFQICVEQERCFK